MVSVGGDNYSMDYGGPSHWLGLDALARRERVPYVIWGASIGPFDNPKVDADVMADLRGSLLVTVRETISRDYLAERGVVANVHHVADPAFLLEPEPVDTSAFWPAGDLVLGLNVSPLLKRFHRSADDVFPEVTVHFIRSVVQRHGLGVLLIPHVMVRATNNDHTYMAAIADAVGDPERVRIAPPHFDACQLKHVISKCDLLVAARTHATIAGFSTGVPTISLAYSQKAHGINRDLFGDGRWVVDARGLTAAEPLLDAVEGLLADRDVVRSHLQQIMPSVKARARSAVDHLAAAM